MVVRRFWPWIRQERALITGAVAALVVGVALRLLEPWPLKLVLDRLFSGDEAASGGGGPMALLVSAALAVVLISGLRACTDYAQKVGFAKIGNRVLRGVRDDVYRHVQALPLAWHRKARGGDLIIRVTRDVSLLRDASSTALLPLAGNVLVLVGMIAVMFVLEWRLALMVTASFPLLWLSTARTGRGIHEAARKQRRREGAMAATAAESIGSIDTVQALALEESFAGQFSAKNVGSQKEDLKAARLSARLGRTVDVVVAVDTATVLFFGAYMVFDAIITPGDLVVFLAYLKKVFRPAKDFAKYTGRLAKAAAAGQRVVELLDTDRMSDDPGAVEAPRLKGEVQFDDLSFGYDGGQRVLDGASLTLRRGETVALVGESGQGKTTLASLLLRLHDPDGGRILVDGEDVRRFTRASLRANVSVVLQDTALFSGTIVENIACVRPEATRDAVETAAKAAGADEFIRGLADGYETVVGERGNTLSCGQRQRIAIARAFLREAPILVLDEPTSALDQKNADAFLNGLDRLLPGCTCLVITHDPRLAARANRTVRLTDGSITEDAA